MPNRLTSSKLRNIFAVLVALAIFASLGLFAYMKIDPVGYRTVIFQPIREFSFFARELDALTRWDDIKTIVVPEPETITIAPVGPYDVEITAGLYRPAQSEAGPAIVLLHGSYPWGRKAGLMRMLAVRLAANGFFVITPDARGFGDTDDPAEIDNPESWRTASDLSRVVDFLAASGDVDSRNIFVLGHSMGANHALEGGLANPKVKALILIGPGRFPQQQDMLVPEWERARFAADRRLEQVVSPDVAKFAYSLGNIRLLAMTGLSEQDHKPILLIDGEKEGEANLSYLSAIVNTLDGPIDYRTLDDTGHYCGVRSFYGSETVYYLPQMFDPFFEIVLEFLDNQRSTVEPANPTS